VDGPLHKAMNISTCSKKYNLNSEHYIGQYLITQQSYEDISQLNFLFFQKPDCIDKKLDVIHYELQML